MRCQLRSVRLVCLYARDQRNLRSFGVSNVNVYTGTSLSNLTNVACADWPGLYFHADAGRTYYLQTYGGGVSVDVVPPPNADFAYSPGDPSVFDDATYSYWNGGYWDPTVNGWDWEFGDGTAATGESVSHRFVRDGDYTVTITVTARGGRTNSATKSVRVRTHDVTTSLWPPPERGESASRARSPSARTHRTRRRCKSTCSRSLHKATCWSERASGQLA